VVGVAHLVIRAVAAVLGSRASALQIAALPTEHHTLQGALRLFASIGHTAHPTLLTRGTVVAAINHAAASIRDVTALHTARKLSLSADGLRGVGGTVGLADVVDRAAARSLIGALWADYLVIRIRGTAAAIPLGATLITEVRTSRIGARDTHVGVRIALFVALAVAALQAHAAGVADSATFRLEIFTSDEWWDAEVCHHIADERQIPATAAVVDLAGAAIV
jgi:hypothetical protein